MPFDSQLPENKDIFQAFLSFVDLENQEAPAIYFRWTLVSMIGAMMGRRVWIPFGASNTYPNQYMILMGPPATKKGTAMKWGKRILNDIGYSRWAPDKCSKEQFIKSMKSFDDPHNELEELENLTLEAPAESYICAEEFVDFLGQNDTGFMMTLTNLWDNPPHYKHEKITGKDVVVYKPTVNLLGASTAETFALSFPVESLGTGFMSRVLLIFSEPTGRRVAWPAIPDPLKQAMLADWFKEIRKLEGEIELSAEAKDFMADIYYNMIFVEDERFTYYMERRQQHLLKLSMIMSISSLRIQITVEDVRKANTMLAAAERRMPRALGEYGASKHSLVAGKIIRFLNTRKTVTDFNELWRVVSHDLDKTTELTEILNNLKTADKVQFKSILGKQGWLSKHTVTKEWDERYVDWSWLTASEL